LLIFSGFKAFIINELSHDAVSPRRLLLSQKIYFL